MASTPLPVWNGTPASTRWWLGLQLGFGVGGGTVWIAGQVTGSDFVGGVGLGLVVAALVLRFGRQAAEAGEDD